MKRVYIVFITSSNKKKKRYKKSLKLIDFKTPSLYIIFRILFRTTKISSDPSVKKSDAFEYLKIPFLHFQKSVMIFGHFQIVSHLNRILFLSSLQSSD